MTANFNGTIAANNKQQTQNLESWPHWYEASALTTRPFLAPLHFIHDKRENELPNDSQPRLGDLTQGKSQLKFLDQLPASVASYLSWLEHGIGIAKSPVQIPLKS